MGAKVFKFRIDALTPLLDFLVPFLHRISLLLALIKIGVSLLFRLPEILHVLLVHTAHKIAARLGLMLHELSGVFDVQQKAPFLVPGNVVADLVGDHQERNDAGDHEDNRLEGIRPGSAAHAAKENVGEHHPADDQTGEPGRDAFGKPTTIEHRRGGRLHKFARGDDADEQVRDHQHHQQRKKHVAKCRRLESVPKKLHLRDVSIALADGPQANTDQEKDRRVYQAAPRGHGAIDGYTAIKRFAGGAHKGKAGHGGAKDAHQQQE